MNTNAAIHRRKLASVFITLSERYKKAFQRKRLHPEMLFQKRKIRKTCENKTRAGCIIQRGGSCVSDGHSLQQISKKDTLSLISFGVHLSATAVSPKTDHRSWKGYNVPNLTRSRYDLGQTKKIKRELQHQQHRVRNKIQKLEKTFLVLFVKKKLFHMTPQHYTIFDRIDRLLLFSPA